MAQPQTKWEQLYDQVHDDIINLRIEPGEKISEIKLAERYSVSRAPVRNVIRKLQEVGLVIVKPQAGTIVLPISEQRAKDILQLRLFLEPQAAKLAVRRITEEDLEHVSLEMENLKAMSLESRDKGAVLSRTDGLLHQLIWDRCGNAEIGVIFKRYMPEMYRISLATRGSRTARMVPSQKEIEAILGALKHRDGDAAYEAMVIHIKNIEAALQQL